MVGDFPFAGHVRRAVNRINGILLIPCGIVRSGYRFVISFRRHVLVDIVHAKFRAVWIGDRGFRAHNAPAANLHVGKAWGIGYSGLPQIGGERLGGLWSGHGAGIVDIALCHSAGDIVGKVAAFL